MPKVTQRLLCLLAICMPLVAQSALPQGAIDGAVTPEKIPDYVALRLFLAALGSPSAAAAGQIMTPTTLKASRG